MSAMGRAFRAQRQAKYQIIQCDQCGSTGFRWHMETGRHGCVRATRAVVAFLRWGNTRWGQP